MHYLLLHSAYGRTWTVAHDHSCVAKIRLLRLDHLLRKLTLLLLGRVSLPVLSSRTAWPYAKILAKAEIHSEV